MPQERPQEPSGWITARRYADARLARRAYEAARNALLIEHDLDASVLRFTLDGVSHVAVVGEQPLNPTETDLVGRALGASGDAVEVPTEIAARLHDRRRTMTRLGFDYVERRTEMTPPDV